MFIHTLLESFRQTSRPAAKVRKKSPPSKGHDALMTALWAHSPTGSRGLSISELAQAMACSVGESSKRVKAAGRLVNVTKQGRKKIVTINFSLSHEEWKRLR